MIVTGSASSWCCGGTGVTASAAKTLSSRVMCGAVGHPCLISAASAALEQQIRAGAESFIMLTSSAGACRGYNETTTMPSAIMARSAATQRMLFEASRAQRSPFFIPRATKKLRACCTMARNSPPVTECTASPRTSRSTGAFAACRSLSKMVSRKVTRPQPLGVAAAFIFVTVFRNASSPLCLSINSRNAGLSGGR